MKFKARRKFGRKRFGKRFKKRAGLYQYGVSRKQRPDMLIFKPPSSLHLPYPSKFVSQLEYSMDGQIPVGVGTSTNRSVYLVKLNSPIFPGSPGLVSSTNVVFTGVPCGGTLTSGSIALSSHTPAGISPLLTGTNSMYTSYRILASKISVQVQPELVTGTGGNTVVDVCVFPATFDELNAVSFSSWTPISQAMAYSYAKDMRCQTYTSGKGNVISNYIGVAKLFGYNQQQYIDEDDNTGASTTDPKNLAHWCVIIENPFNLSTSVVAVRTKVKYYIEYFNPVRNAELDE